jgi:prepilin-type N-terminal cleavage/methylation domain-containing protein
MKDTFARVISLSKQEEETMKRGFTLIELLIVVAIIAILAAIAVPNFLEAQVRAKVSRVKNDHRTLGTAFESYLVDHNHYPYPLSFTVRTVNIVELTTPVAYMTSVDLQDPFTPNDWPWGEWRGYLYVNYHGYWRNVHASASYPAREGWIVTSFGPDRDLDALEHYPGQMIYWPDDVPARTWNVQDVPNALYDTTNGTISSGDIGRAGGDLPVSGIVGR